MTDKIKIPFKQGCWLFLKYFSSKIIEQIKKVSVIIIYLIFFQMFVLHIRLSDSLIIAMGLGVAILGLTFFSEGIMLGLMPLGEDIGLKLPQKTTLFVILIFSFVLGIIATLAEPAITSLKANGAQVRAWEAPLLYALLNRYSYMLALSIGIGVGLASSVAMVRFFFNISLKPFLYVSIIILVLITGLCMYSKELISILGLAWDSGGITTGPVTVPLVLALGIGVSRMVSQDDNNLGGFGVVTLASLFPVCCVIVLGVLLLPKMPSADVPQDFFAKENKARLISVFGDEDHIKKYLAENTDETVWRSYFTEEEYNDFVKTHIKSNSTENNISAVGVSFGKLFVAAIKSALLSITPLIGVLFLIFIIFIREKINRIDEIMLGIVFSVIGLSLFMFGQEFGLSNLGNQVGSSLPSAFTEISADEDKIVIADFDKSLVNTAVSLNGEKQQFFFIKQGRRIIRHAYDESCYDEATRTYSFEKTYGPVFEHEVFGFILVILFGFFMGYSASLAEPALNALAYKVESLSGGSFKSGMLVQSVAVGVGVGIAIGVLKIIVDLPLIYILAPTYIVLLILTQVAREDYVCIAWDSAGVTTGPVTVPLVIALGLGISNQVGVTEGFGILASASAFPILAVLVMGIIVSYKRQKFIK